MHILQKQCVQRQLRSPGEKAIVPGASPHLSYHGGGEFRDAQQCTLDIMEETQEVFSVGLLSWSAISSPDCTHLAPRLFKG